MSDSLKSCSRCQREQPLDQFTRDKQAPDGLNRRCRECKTALSKQDRDTNRQRRLDYEAAWRQANRQAVNDAARKWRAENREAHLEAKRRWRERNPDHGRTYYEAHQVESYERTHRRRALLAEVTSGPVDLEALWDGDCALCGESIDRELKWPDPLSPSLDHIVPLAKGGTHEQANLQWAHLVCNIRKGASVPAVVVAAAAPPS